MRRDGAGQGEANEFACGNDVALKERIRRQMREHTTPRHAAVSPRLEIPCLERRRRTMNPEHRTIIPADARRQSPIPALPLIAWRWAPAVQSLKQLCAIAT